MDGVKTWYIAASALLILGASVSGCKNEDAEDITNMNPPKGASAMSPNKSGTGAPNPAPATTPSGDSKTGH